MTNKKAEKYLLKSKVAPMYVDCPDAQLKTQIVSGYKKMIEENNVVDKTVFYQNAYYIYSTVAIYTAFQAYGYRKEKTQQDIEKLILATGKNTSRFLSKIGKCTFFFPLFKKMCFFSTKTSYKKPYFDMRWSDYGKDKIAWECHKCHYQDQFAKYNCSELTEIFCKLDDVMYGNIPTALWDRTQTIGGGDAVCDFCFIKKTEVS
ncbi:MAG: L-2-amino-thiazoline-4-carboxylic acid hydrolase [Spirochaetales bacterium]